MLLVVPMARRKTSCNNTKSKKSNLERKASVKKIKRLMKTNKDPRFIIRAYIIILAKKGKSVCIIAWLLSVSEVTVRFWIRRFNDEGYRGLFDRPRSGRKKKIDDEKFAAIISTSPHAFGVEMDYWTVRTLHSVLEKHFKVNYGRNYLYEMIRRRGYTLKKPRPRHYKADPQRANSVKRQIKQIVAAGYPVFYEDETKVKLTTRMAKVVAKRGQAVIMRVNVDHRGVFVLGAINVRSREVTILLSDHANSESVMKLLYKLKAQVGRGRLYVVWDNNGSHISKRVKYLAKKKGIHLVQLPPYMPELNPMEEVWKLLKDHLANRLFFEIGELRREVMNFFASRGYRFEIKIESYFSE